MKGYVGLVLALWVTSCTPAPLREVAPAKAVSPTELRFGDLSPTTEESAWRNERVSRKVPLSVATIRVLGTFEEAPDGRRSGFDYQMARQFAEVLGLPLTVTVPDDLRRFFSHNGTIPSDVETNQNLNYTPDLLQTVDLYIGPFSLLPWRERLMTMVPLYPMQNFLAGRKGEEIHAVSELNGRRLAVLKDSMQDNLLHKLATDRGLHLAFTYVRPEDDMFTVVAKGQADYTLDGALFFAQNRIKMKGLSLSTFPSDPVSVGWAMKKSDTVLASLVRKYIDKIQANGSFSTWFEAAFGTSFADYLSVLATTGGTP